jgi:hypothetical protein
MSPLWFLVVPVVVVPVALLWLRGAQPYAHRHVPLSGFPRLLDAFLGKLDTGGVLIADRESGEGFLQLAIGNWNAQWHEVEFGLPDVGWSTHYFEATVSALANAGFTPAVEPGSGQVSRFLRVRITGPAPLLRERLSQLLVVAATALSWSPGDLFTVRLKGPLRQLPFRRPADTRSA